MTGNIAIDVAIGLIFVYCLYSLLATTISEFIAMTFQMRAKNLKRAIGRMLDDENSPVLSEGFYKAPLIKYLSRGKLMKFFGNNSLPSNIPPELFSKALLYMLKEGKTSGINPAGAIKASLESISGGKQSDTISHLLFLLEESNGDMEKFTTMLEQWFDATMERCSGWYKRNMSYVTLGLSLLIATLFNIDSFQIIGTLSKDSVAREQYVQLAGNLMQSTIFSESEQPKAPGILHDTLQRTKTINDSNTFGNENALNIFYAQKLLLERMDSLYTLSQEPRSILSFERKNRIKWFYSDLQNFLGCLVTAIALSLGAPFWFDLLNKLMKLRSSIPIGKSAEKKEIPTSNK
ncbi:MAG: hypothetical protein JXB34_09290 [Bacteroidales bacterium]|nr:hypothetical protein [Bacteroidales bacterium]